MSTTDKLRVAVAPCIPPYLAVNVPGLDLSPAGIADEVVRAYNAGANAVHLQPCTCTRGMSRDSRPLTSPRSSAPCA